VLEIRERVGVGVRWGRWGRGGEKNFSNFDSLGHLGKQVGVKRVAIVIEFVKFGG
jgi:hypothetical protein